MSILSLQSIIQKYGARYGIDTKSPLKDAAKDSGKKPGKGAVKAAAAIPAAKSPQKPAGATGKIPPSDSVKLSPAAKDFLASHTGALGKFETPNVLDAFLGAMHGSDRDGSGEDTGNGPSKSLLDFL
jgi:hypothetical protein